MKTYLLAAAAALALVPAAAQAEAFDGAYGGVELGWERNRSPLGDAFNYGLYAGYNKKVADALVLGVEAKAALTTADTKLGNVELEGGRSLGAAARVGVLANEKTMVFGKLGYENVRLEWDVENGNDWHKNYDALVLGAGVEYALNPKAVVRVGYDYTNGEDGYRRHSVKTGVAFHF